MASDEIRRLQKENECLQNELAALKMQLSETQQVAMDFWNYSRIGMWGIDVLEDGSFRIIGINPMHEKLFSLKNDKVAGRFLDELTFHLDEATMKYVKGLYKECVETKRPVTSEFFCEIEGKKDWWLSTMTPLLNEEGRVYRMLGHAITITELMEEREAKEKAVQGLDKARETLKNLSEIIPICSSCKKVRSDENSWQQIELFMAAHAELLFSHSLCPDCVAELYPGISQKS